MYLSVQESIFFTKFPSQYLLSDQVSTYRHSFIFINFYHHFQNTQNYPFCLYPFRCLYIGIQNSAQMSSLRSGVYNITGKNKVGTRIVYNIFWLDEPVQVSIYRNTEFWPNVLCPFRCLYIDIPFLGQMRFWPKISRKIDALTGVSLPQLRLRFVGKICYANQKMRCYASQRIQRATHVKILNSFAAICEVKSQYRIPPFMKR